LLKEAAAAESPGEDGEGVEGTDKVSILCKMKDLKHPVFYSSDTEICNSLSSPQTVPRLYKVHTDQSWG